jgi:PAS domain S-box-containing protein
MEQREAVLGPFWERSLDMLAIATPDGVFRDVNDNWERTLGLTRDELIGQPYRTLVHPDDLAATERQLQALTVPGGAVSGFENRFRTARNGYRWLRWNATTDDDGTVFCIVRDVTRERAADAALRESEERFRLAMEHAPIGLALVALDGTWIDVNDALCDIVGRDREELLGLTFQDITHPDDLDADLAFAEQLLAGVIPRYQMEKRYFHGDGYVVWANLSGSLVRDDDGRPLYFIAQIEDITESKRDRAALERAVHQLERSNADLQRFAAVASHDLKSPLAVVRGVLDLLRLTHADQLGTDGMDLLERAERNAAWLGDLVDALLRLESVGAGDLELAPLDLSEVVADVCQRLEGELDGVTIDVGTLPVVEADRDQMAVAVQNLFLNALKYRAPDRPLHVQVRASPAGAQWRITFEDNGIGFDPADREAIFEMFGRSSKGQQVEGAGIGLATVRRIVEAHGGSVHAELVPRNGARFVLLLPTEAGYRPRLRRLDADRHRVEDGVAG